VRNVKWPHLLHPQEPPLPLLTAHLRAPGVTEEATIGPLEGMSTVTVTATEDMKDTDHQDTSKSSWAIPKTIDSDGH
jgi:hypothetical protein